MNSFDLRSILLERHAQHVVLVHFPIALCLTGILFDWLAQWTKSRPLADAAYYNLLIAAWSTVPVVATGLLAWRWQLEGQRLKGTLLLHLVFGVTTTALIWMVWGLHRRVPRWSPRELSRYRLPLEVATAALVIATAHLGGILSGVNGPA